MKRNGFAVVQATSDWIEVRVPIPGHDRPVEITLLRDEVIEMQSRINDATDREIRVAANAARAARARRTP